jgi:ubiquinol-cytochrome c reductase cytochrome b subunit
MASEKAKELMNWLDERLPVTKFLDEQLNKYFAPKNFNFLYFFGSLAILVLVNQILTGIFLAMSYKPDAALAFDSVEYIMRDVRWGWLLRYLHSTGASLFFVVIYLHMFRALFYGSFKKPRELLWLFGMVIYVLLAAEAFTGYLLPWGQMSYWGAQVIISLFGAIPVVGEDLTTWIRGDYVIADATLNRFFAFHVAAIPLAIIMLVVLHLAALRTTGSNNPDGVEIKKNKNELGIPVDGIPFHPYYTVKDLYVMGIFLTVFAFIVFYTPEMGGLFLEHPNFDPADPMKTPEHIQPVWYFTPFYSILRAVPNKLGGVFAMTASFVLLFFLPWLDTNPVKSIRYRGWPFKLGLAVFVVSFFVLGVLGTKPVSPTSTVLARISSLGYFGFLLLLPVISRFEVTKPLPERLTEPVIPLAKREGPHWRLLETLLQQAQQGGEKIRGSAAYQKACARVAGIIERLLKLSGCK